MAGRLRNAFSEFSRLSTGLQFPPVQTVPPTQQTLTRHRYLTINQVARRFEVSPATVCRWCDSEQIKFIDLSGPGDPRKRHRRSIKFLPEDVETFERTRRHPSN
jgi:hypothetical protein